jgi:hypothetical protein
MIGRRIERALLGAVMSMAAWVTERWLIRASRRRTVR